MNYIKLVKTLFSIKGIINEVKENKMDFKTVAGWVKIIGYVATLASMIMSFIDPKIALSIILILSAVVKVIDVYTAQTKNTQDDEFARQVTEILQKNNLIK